MRWSHLQWGAALAIATTWFAAGCFSPPTPVSEGSSTSQEECTPEDVGTADCPCFPNGTCLFDGLVCMAGTCVDAGATTVESSSTTSGSTDPTGADGTSSGGDTTGDTGSTGETEGSLCEPFLGFQNGDFSQRDGWTLGDGVSFQSDRLEFAGGAICFGEQASQDVCVPPYDAKTGPLMLRMLDPQIDFMSCNAPDCEVPSLQIAYGPEPNLLYTNDNLRSLDVCIGEAGYGGIVPFSISAPGTCQAFTTSYDEVSLDWVSTQECPAPGTVLNGSFDESSGDGWVDISPSATFEIIGQGADDLAGQFQIAGGVCNTARALGRFAPPAAGQLDAPAMRFSAASAGRSFDLVARVRNVAPFLTDVFTVPEGEQEVVFCLPPELAGGSYVIELEVSGGNSCASVVAGTLTIDDFEIVASPGECG